MNMPKHMARKAIRRRGGMASPKLGAAGVAARRLGIDAIDAVMSVMTTAPFLMNVC